MSLQPKLGITKVRDQRYWSTNIGGRRKYFGRVDQVDRADALREFYRYLSAVNGEAIGIIPDSPDVAAQKELIKSRLNVWTVCDKYLEWCSLNLSVSNTNSKKTHLNYFCNHTIRRKELVGCGFEIGELAWQQIKAQHLDDFLQTRREEVALSGRRKGEPVSPTSLWHAQVHVKACWAWAADPQRGHLFPSDHLPLAGIKKPTIPPRTRGEWELPTEEEIEILLENADIDIAPIRSGRKFRARLDHERRTGEDNPYKGFVDILRFYLHTGARTAEPGNLVVGDVNLKNRVITLGKHKRTQTMSDPTLRVIDMDNTVFEIMGRYCEGKTPDRRVFTQPSGSPWNQDRLNERFRLVRDHLGLRQELTIYSFRHLWISDLMEDPEIPVGTIAHMAGTSIEQIQKTYGHLRRNESRAALARLDEKRKNRQAEVQKKKAAKKRPK